MRQPTKHTAVLVLLSLLASFVAVTTTAGTASAAESIPTLQWSSPTSVSQYVDHTVTAPNGDVTVPCTSTGSGSDLVTYNSSGQVVRQLDHTSLIDGVQNCINNPAVDKNGTLYGVPGGGPNLLAYSGNTLKWEYPAHCDNNGAPPVVVGADGNIYVVTYGHLIGLTPDVAPPLTQPAKVMDIPILPDCSIRLFPYKDGIMLHGQQSGNPLYYSYASKSLGQAPLGQLNTEKTGANGRLFTYSTVAGSYTSTSVSAWDPRTGQTTWTTSASTPGANTSGGPNLYSMEDGGVAVVSTEQKMDPSGSGVPVTPTQWVPGVSIINAAGIKTRSFQFSTDYSNGGVTGNYDTAMTITPDNTGKLVVVRELMLNTKLSWPNPSTVPAIDISVYDPVTDTWPYHQVMSGDLAKNGGPDGYSWNYGANSVSIAGNTVYLMAACTNNCSDYSTKLYAVQVSGLGMDYPRGDVLTANTPTQPAPVSYVALGDSFSSGEGVTPFDPSTDVSSTDMCHRSYLAYSELTSLNPSLSVDLNQGGFYACSGSQTSDILSDQSANNVKNHEGAQLNHLNANTKVVTLTIGGNDIGFSDFATACVMSLCDSTTSIYATTVAKIQQDLPWELKGAYEHILATAPNAKVYVLDYPFVVGVKNSTDGPDARCLYLDPASNPWSNAQAARDIITDIDQTISDTVTTVKNEKADYDSRLRYVPVNGANSPFTGHGLCDSGSSYFQNVDNIVTGNKEYVFHPNADGQAAYAQLVAGAIAAG